VQELCCGEEEDLSARLFCRVGPSFFHRPAATLMTTVLGVCFRSLGIPAARYGCRVGSQALWAAWAVGPASCRMVTELHLSRGGGKIRGVLVILAWAAGTAVFRCAPGPLQPPGAGALGAEPSVTPPRTSVGVRSVCSFVVTVIGVLGGAGAPRPQEGGRKLIALRVSVMWAKHLKMALSPVDRSSAFGVLPRGTVGRGKIALLSRGILSPVDRSSSFGVLPKGSGGRKIIALLGGVKSCMVSHCGLVQTLIGVSRAIPMCLCASRSLVSAGVATA
jgi:hypothetical protein